MPKPPRQTYTDKTPMPWGEHKGTPIGKVDNSYLLWLFRQDWISEWPDLHAYLVSNQDVLLLESDEDDAENEGEFKSFDDYMRYGRG